MNFAVVCLAALLLVHAAVRFWALDNLDQLWRSRIRRPVISQEMQDASRNLLVQLERERIRDQRFRQVLAKVRQ